MSNPLLANKIVFKNIAFKNMTQYWYLGGLPLPWLDNMTGCRLCPSHQHKFLFVNYETAMLSSLERSFFFNVHNIMMNHHWWLIKYLHIICYISFKSSSSCGFCVITAKANCGVFSNSSIWLLVSIYLLVLPVKLLHPLPPRLLMQLELRQTFPHAFTPRDLTTT